jgi:Xaa-Pro aminopeptidase
MCCREIIYYIRIEENMEISKRVEKLRYEMKKEGVDAYIISSSDPHQTECAAPRYQARKWISGFTGSAGVVVITEKDAGIWVDSRYYIQAEAECKENGFTIFRMGMKDVPELYEWITDNLESGDTVGLDGMVFSLKRCRTLGSKFTPKGIKLRTDIDLIDRIWAGRPGIPEDKAEDHDVKYAGRSREEKIADIRDAVLGLNADAHLICRLDDIAWALNVRGSDMEHQPLVTSFLLISQSECVWFINSEKLSANLAAEMKIAGVRTLPYDSICEYLSNFDKTQRLLVNPADISKKLFDAIPKICKVVGGESPVPLMKSCKNLTEVEGAWSACARDGAAMVKFLIWLEENVQSGSVTEIQCAEKLAEFRSGMELFKDLSFNSIVAYQEHGAVCHYSATEESNSVIKPEGLLLIDSGGHYLDGTTDITRTIPLGKLSEQQQIDYTLVLKAHINLALAIFPCGTRGADLEVLAKIPLWQAGRDYGHGAGHGVGSYLMVHEGPAGFGSSQTTLQEGMVLTNEPGLYREGQYGIRTENMVTVTECDETEFGTFYELETITMCPIPLSPVLTDLLSDEEIEWLEFYHEDVRISLEPLLNEKEMAWLKKATTF